MKKIDLHIHTKASLSDSTFIFSLDKLKEYVDELSIDCIAITNHNLFDLEQFRSICDELDCKVFPGIEINLEKGHLLLERLGSYWFEPLLCDEIGKRE